MVSVHPSGVKNHTCGPPRNFRFSLESQTGPGQSERVARPGVGCSRDSIAAAIGRTVKSPGDREDIGGRAHGRAEPGGDSARKG